MSRLSLLLWGCALGLAVACGGGGGGGAPVSTTPATALVYTDPIASGTRWQLVLDPASTPSRQILDLMAPANASGLGVTLVLTANPSEAGWHAFAPGSYLQGSVFGASPLVNVASVQGGALRIVVAQAPGTPVAYGTAPVFQVALDLAPGAVTGAVPLTVTGAGQLGSAPTPTVIAVDLGSLAAH